MKTPFLHLVKRLGNTGTPADWFPDCLQEATGYAPQALPASSHAALRTRLLTRGERLRPRHLASTGALFAGAGHAPQGGILILPASGGELPATAAHDLYAQLVARGRDLLDAALTDPRLLAGIDLGAPPASIAGLAGLQFLRDRHALAVGHFLRGNDPQLHAPAVDATSVCVQIAGLPSPLVLWLGALIAAVAGAGQALVLTEDDGSLWGIGHRHTTHAALH